MPGFVPGIHVLDGIAARKDVDGRDNYLGEDALRAFAWP